MHHLSFTRRHLPNSRSSPGLCSMMCSMHFSCSRLMTQCSDSEATWRKETRKTKHTRHLLTTAAKQVFDMRCVRVGLCFYMSSFELLGRSHKKVMVKYFIRQTCCQGDQRLSNVIKPLANSCDHRLIPPFMLPMLRLSVFPRVAAPDWPDELHLAR